MPSLASLLSVVHIVGLALSVGAASVKVVLLLRCRVSATFVPSYLAVIDVLTRHIVFGLVLLTLSGVGWLLLGYGITTLLTVKLVLVGIIWVLGPIIDKVAEPRFRQLAPVAGAATNEYAAALRRYLALEITATSLFYVVILVWMLG